MEWGEPAQQDVQDDAAAPNVRFLNHGAKEQCVQEHTFSLPMHSNLLPLNALPLNGSTTLMVATLYSYFNTRSIQSVLFAGMDLETI
eukprot:1157570-Pelagomonas_calceolata.AAC.6